MLSQIKQQKIAHLKSQIDELSWQIIAQNNQVQLEAHNKELEHQKNFGLRMGWKQRVTSLIKNQRWLKNVFHYSLDLITKVHDYFRKYI